MNYFDQTVLCVWGGAGWLAWLEYSLIKTRLLLFLFFPLEKCSNSSPKYFITDTFCYKKNVSERHAL